jgi:hypothetical protein
MITIVSGLPRSGTSLMMQMLVAGGMTALSDGERQADIDNPKGYLEWERIKQLPKDPTLIAEAEGKVVKVISQLLLSLPLTYVYRIVFMQRPLAEVLKSQEQMLQRRGTADTSVEASAMTRAFQNHLYEVNTWLNGKPNFEVLRVQYHHLLNEGHETCQRISTFLNLPLNMEAMLAQVDQSLYRNRALAKKIG